MTTQSVMAQTANLFGNAGGRVTLKGKHNNGGFDQLIGNSLKAQNPFSTESAGKKISAQQPDTHTDDQSDVAAGVAGRAGTQQTNSAQQAGSADTAEQTGKAKPAEEEAALEETDDTKDKAEEIAGIDQQLLAQLTALLQAVSEAVMDKLNLSPEEFNKLLSNQGMTAADLLDPGNLQKFILANFKETDISAVLTNENLADTMKELMQQVNEILTEAEIPLNFSQIKEVLAKAEEAKVMSGQNIPVREEAAVQSADTQNKPEDVKGTDTTVRPEVTDPTNANQSKTETRQISQAGITDNSQTETVKGTTAKESTQGQDNKELNSADPFQMFVDNMMKVVKDIGAEFTDSMNQVINIREIADQIIDRIKIAITSDQSSMELQLNPESLGKVNLTVQSKDGVLTAQFVVQNELSKEAIESQLNTLKETLNQQGIKVEAIEVTISANSFGQNNGEGEKNQADTKESNSGRQITMEEAMNMTELPEEESTLQDITGTLGSQVDITA